MPKVPPRRALSHLRSYSRSRTWTRLTKSEAVGHDGSATGAVPTAVIDLSGHQALQPPSDSGQTGALPVMTPKQTASGTTDESPIRNGRGAPVDLASVLLEEPSDGAVLLRAPSSGSLISDQGPSPVTENQAAGNVLPASSVIGGVQSLDRLSTGVQPSAKVQEQGAQETTLLDQSLSIPVIGESGEGGGDPFGADAQGAGEGLFFYSRDNGVLELAARGNQSLFFQRPIYAGAAGTVVANGTGLFRCDAGGGSSQAGAGSSWGRIIREP